MLSLHVIVKDEEPLLSPLLAFVQQHVDEMVIVDTGSTDRTIEVARLYTSKVFEHPLGHDFSGVRNFALTKATEPWVLHIDADEWPTLELLDWIRMFLATSDDHSVSCVEIRRQNYIDGKPIGVHTYEWHRRLFRRELRYVGRIHEKLVVDSDLVLRAPEELLLLHHKSAERQAQQDEFYKQWPEQPRE